MHTMRFQLVVAIVFLVCPIGLAQSGWTLTTADLERRNVSLRGLDDQGVAISSVGGQQTIPMDRFLQIERAAATTESAGEFTLYLAGGDRVGGRPVSLAEEQLKWNSPAVGELTIPIRQAAALVKSSAPPPDLDAARAQDVVRLDNGDRVEGIVTEINADRITLNAGGDPLPIAMDAILAIEFATAGQAAPPAQRGFRIRLSDGSALVAPRVKLEGDELALHLPDGTERRVKLGGVSAIEQVRGPVLWLSSLKPIEEKQVPQFDLTWPTRMDRTVTGQRIRHGRVYERGIGVHAKSILVFSVDGPYGAFRTQYAIDGDGPLADVSVRIKLDDRIVHTQENVKAGEVSAVVLVPLDDAKTLTLEVDYGANGDTQDRFNWIEPALLRHMPHAAATQP